MKMIVGGTFDSNGGKKSHIIQKMSEYFPDFQCINGGHINDLYKFRPNGISVLIWMPNVDNSQDKILPRLKVMNPKMILISSKRLIEKEYTEYELVNRLINTRSNLGLTITKRNGLYYFSLIDPLGNIYCDGSFRQSLFNTLRNKINHLSEVKRLPSIRSKIDCNVIDDIVEKRFIDLVHKFSDRFSELMEGHKTDRFLGNASTRCEYAFPSSRSRLSKDYAMVSKRNVDKSGITKDNFVKTTLTDEAVLYYGKDKPSVDTAVQLELYKWLPNINYMIHGHCYIEDAPFTKNKVPCGDLREVDEIKDLFADHNLRRDCDFIMINLLGHGCIVMANSIEDLYNIKLIPRPLLED